MHASSDTKADLNRADLEELTHIPGVGSALAGRIIEERPYASADDLGRVRGIGPAFLERIRPFIKVEDGELSSQDDEPAPSPTVEAAEDQGGADRPISEPVSRGEVLWLAGGSALIAVIVTLVLTLGILGVINGGLRFIRLGEFVELTRQAETLSSDLAFIEIEVGDLRTRLDSLETLSGRMTAVETDLETVQGVSAAAAEQVAAMETELNQIAADLEVVHTEVSVFQQFLDGLRDLLLAAPVGGGIPNDN